MCILIVEQKGGDDMHKKETSRKKYGGSKATGREIRRCPKINY